MTFNLIIEKTRRLAHGFRSFEHYRLRVLLAASGTRPTGEHVPTLNPESCHSLWRCLRWQFSGRPLTRVTAGGLIPAGLKV